ncbi:hypothetical protein SAMD00019534_087670 [Acytostelium subglobosum LB1]|uniref:hypothetical protein n=1 Tax=Acytostelium subglobosum LB1 TaxID=1410327 RepID=UPI000645222F|nr:hypothetical protein SAMD00019534_087670 [Acytostelium subglobosum LB1]GAM25592.1 hypothetical protein SAMD00019534_087670 [Acytostelium subglobosum LB1]|eukprot:XP_012751578.1 hypothetical protein SAMD00019534_087670 [Acytostelium subglobosum LB1]
MSFKLTWGPFDDEFYNKIKSALNKTLNSGPPIPNIVDQLLVHQFHLGDVPPSIVLLKVADASKEKFRFIFHVKYNGNGLLELRTRVQANPVYLGTSITPSRSERAQLKKLNIGSASNPHIMPLSIIITDIIFDGELSVTFINNKSIEACFATDPLKQVIIKTSFDDFPAAANFIKKLVDLQLRNFIMKDFPAIVGSITVPSPPSPQAQSTNNNSASSPIISSPSFFNGHGSRDGSSFLNSPDENQHHIQQSQQQQQDIKKNKNKLKSSNMASSVENKDWESSSV